MKLFPKATLLAAAIGATGLAGCSSTTPTPSANTAIPSNAKPVPAKLTAAEKSSATTMAQRVINDELAKNYSDLYSVLEPSEKSGTTESQYALTQSQVGKLLTLSAWTLNGTGCAASLGSDVFWQQPTSITATVVSGASSGQTETNQADTLYLLKSPKSWYWVESSVPKAFESSSSPVC